MSFQSGYSQYYTLPPPTAGPSTGPEPQKKLALAPGQDLDLGTIELYTDDDLRDWWKKAAAGQKEGDASITSECAGQGKLVDIDPSAYSPLDGELPIVTGGDFADSKGRLKGYLYFIPAGTQWLSLLPSCTPEAVLFANKLDVTPRDFTSGFLGVSTRFEWFAIDFFGPFAVTEPGVYTFRLQSDDGSILWIDGKVVANNDGAHPPMNVLGNTQLARGVHAIRILYYQGLRTGVALQLFVTPPNRSEQLWTSKL
jgi:hypothetical protein